MSNESNYSPFDKDGPWPLYEVEEFRHELDLADYTWPYTSLIGGGAIRFYNLPGSTDVLALSVSQCSEVSRYLVLTRENFEQAIELSSADSCTADGTGYKYHCALVENAEQLAYFDSDDVSYLKRSKEELDFASEYFGYIPAGY